MNRIVRPLTGEEKARDAKVREQVMKEFPPVAKKKHSAAVGRNHNRFEQKETEGTEFLITNE